MIVFIRPYCSIVFIYDKLQYLLRYLRRVKFMLFILHNIYSVYNTADSIKNKDVSVYYVIFTCYV